jgi:hypothetical protein
MMKMLRLNLYVSKERRRFVGYRENFGRKDMRFSEVCRRSSQVSEPAPN